MEDFNQFPLQNKAILHTEPFFNKIKKGLIKGTLFYTSLIVFFGLFGASIKAGIVWTCQRYIERCDISIFVLQ